MADDPLIDQMQRWGYAQAARFAANDDGASQGDSVLARQRDLGLRYKRKKEEEREIVGRCGEDRRRFMANKIAAQSEGKLRLGMVPMWAVDPVRGRNDAGAPRDLPQANVDAIIPDELRWVDSALSQLWRTSPIRALIVRTEFMTTGTHAIKARRVEEEYGGSVTVRQYRYELARALDFLRGRRAA